MSPEHHHRSGGRDGEPGPHLPPPQPPTLRDHLAQLAAGTARAILGSAASLLPHGTGREPGEAAPSAPGPTETAHPDRGADGSVAPSVASSEPPHPRHAIPPHGEPPRSEPHQMLPAGPTGSTGTGGGPDEVPPRAVPLPRPHEKPSAVPAAGELPRHALPAAAPDLDTVALGGRQGFVVPAATWLRPDGYVEWEGALCRAHWQGPASAYPRPGDLVRVTVTPDSEPPLLQARPLH
ncbi:hypothetical protein [Streptomyces zaomyceticus]|uniref:hypothetical protein n=1 Tax=Streptomyces zaomyceticus TaxID=68286 RepID=UPI002E23F87A